MRIQRYIAKDMRSALGQVREAMGPEAVILSSGTVGDQVEVVAAIDVEVAREFATPRGAPQVTPSENVAMAPSRRASSQFSEALIPSEQRADAAAPALAAAPRHPNPRPRTTSSRRKSKTCAACSRRSSRRSRGTTCRAARRCRPRC
jgi:flagellar biosynthesis protein FlhF